jgi:sigma-B regulation protein RsbU (phosphoserine phosphatase)
MSSLEITRTPAFIVTDPEGNRTRRQVDEFPFTIGRQAGNHLMLRDARASRHHARLTIEDGEYILEDLQSRHGVFVNGDRLERKALQDGDRIEFGFPDSFSLTFERPGSRVVEIADQLAATELTDRGSTTNGNLPRLRAVLEVARALQTSFSIDAILNAVLDAALALTHAERGFLLLKKNEILEVRSARSVDGPLPEQDLKVPRNLILQELESRTQTFSMQFDPMRESPSASAYALELKSVVCIPLVRIQISSEDGKITPGETAGVLYLDSRVDARDLAQGNQDLLETLAVEASTVLENARLLEQDRARQLVQEELALARHIQQSLLPSKLPDSGWLRAAGYSMPSREVGGDYYDLFHVAPDYWAAVVADVAGKGVSAALGASFLQGAFLGIDSRSESLRQTIERLDAFFKERGQKHATVFCALVDPHGNFHYVNAGHCAPVLIPLHSPMITLDAASSAVGLLDEATFRTGHCFLESGDRVVIYSDGLTDLQNPAGDFFGLRRLKEVIGVHAALPCAELHQAILEAVEDFTAGHEQSDDLTLLVLEYRPD